MREEYDLTGTNNASDCIKAMETFMNNCSGYNMIQPLTPFVQNTNNKPYFDNPYQEYFCVENIEYGLYLVFFRLNDYVSLLVTTEFDSNEIVFYMKDIILHNVTNTGEIGSWMTNSDTQGRDYNVNYAYFIPAPTLHCVTAIDRWWKLVGNYNATNNTVMFSLVMKRGKDYQTIAERHYVNKTYSIVFGGLSKYHEYDGGFFYGGDFVFTYELIHRSSMEYKNGSYEKTYLYSYINVEPDATYKDIRWHLAAYDSLYQGSRDDTWLDIPWDYNSGDINNAYFSNYKPDTNEVGKLHLFLRANIDKAPDRDEKEFPENDIYLDNIGGTPQYYLPKLKVSRTWCITTTPQAYTNEPTITSYYVPMVISISDRDGYGLPTYNPLYSHAWGDNGHTANTLNNISLVFELYAMVLLDPWENVNFSCVGYSKIINYVNMKYMSTNTIEDGDFPIDKGKFNCFNMGRRRSQLGSLWYSGLAFRQEDD